MAAFDVYREPDQLPDAVVEVMADRLEGRAKYPRFVQMREQYLDAMDIDAASSYSSELMTAACAPLAYRVLRAN